MGLKLIQVDAFTSERFRGNPAAVCVLKEPVEEGWMQNLAREMNLSETAFLLKEADAFRLRWFTPATEVDLCGHATLASAHVLWRFGYVDPQDPIRFHTRSGLLTARRRGEWIELDFPAQRVEPIQTPAGLEDALGVKIKFTGYDGSDYLVEVESEDVVRALHPALSQLKAFPVRGVMVTSRAKKNAAYDFVSRFFAPACGIDEDPVTGSAHCSLGPFWARRLGKQDLLAYQASPRGGFVKVSVQEDRVLLCGQAVTVFQGELA